MDGEARLVHDVLAVLAEGEKRFMAKEDRIKLINISRAADLLQGGSKNGALCMLPQGISSPEVALSASLFVSTSQEVFFWRTCYCQRFNRPDCHKDPKAQALAVERMSLAASARISVISH